MPKELIRFQRNEPRTLIEAAEANKLVDAVNALFRMQISPAEFGNVKQAENNTILDLSPLREYIKKAVADAITQATTSTTGGNGGGTSDGGSSGSSGSSGGGSSIDQRVTNIESRLNHPSATASCNPDGTITVTITI